MVLILIYSSFLPKFPVFIRKETDTWTFLLYTIHDIISGLLFRLLGAFFFIFYLFIFFFIFLFFLEKDEERKA